MKNRKLLYLLVPMTVVLWGLIVVRIFNQLSKANEITTVLSLTDNRIMEKQVDDTFNIAANYSDPFLNRKMLSVNGNNYESGIRINDIPKSGLKATVKWPDVRYGGIILNKSNNKIVYMIRVDNINHLINKGEQIGQIKIAKVFKDSITIQLKNNFKTIKKEKL